MSAENLEIKDSFIFKIHSLVVLTDKILESQLQTQLKINRSQFLILYFLTAMSCINQQNIATILNMSSAGVSKQITKIEAMGMLAKSPKQKDKRQHIWQITDYGQQVLQEANKIVMEFSKKYQTGLTEGEMEIFQRVLNKILADVSREYHQKFNFNC